MTNFIIQSGVPPRAVRVLRAGAPGDAGRGVHLPRVVYHGGLGDDRDHRLLHPALHRLQVSHYTWQLCYCKFLHLRLYPYSCFLCGPSKLATSRPITAATS